MVTKKKLRDSNWYSLKDYHGETTDALDEDVDSLAAGISKTVFKVKKMQRWRGVWNIWSLMQRRSDIKSGTTIAAVTSATELTIYGKECFVKVHLVDLLWNVM